jgi:hypothetical protein
MSGVPSPTPEFNRQPSFREIEPIPQWSARIALDVPYDDFLSIVLATATETQHRYTGTLIRDPASGNVLSFTHTRFRRNKYGEPPSIPACEQGMGDLASKFGTTYEREQLAPGTTRIVLGLYEGQHATGSRAEPDGPDYSIEDVVQALGSEFGVRPAEVFSTRLHPNGSATHYAEELAEVIFPTPLKQQVYLLGHEMKQERFSVEDFAELQGQSYMVETKWCRDPDPPHPIEPQPTNP